jgi:hypothetical protein
METPMKTMLFLFFILSLLPTLSFADTFDPLGMANTLYAANDLYTPIAVSNSNGIDPSLLSNTMMNMVQEAVYGWSLSIAGLTTGALIPFSFSVSSPTNLLGLYNIVLPPIVMAFSSIGVWIAGNNKYITGNYFATLLGSIIGFELGFFCFNGNFYMGTINYPNKEYEWNIFLSEIIFIPIFATLGAMIGFNLSRQYKEGAQVPPVSIKAYEVQYGAGSKMDVVSTVNVLSIAF